MSWYGASNIDLIILVKQKILLIIILLVNIYSNNSFMHFPLLKIQFYQWINCEIRFDECLPKSTVAAASVWRFHTADNSFISAVNRCIAYVINFIGMHISKEHLTKASSKLAHLFQMSLSNEMIYWRQITSERTSSDEKSTHILVGQES